MGNDPRRLVWRTFWAEGISRLGDSVSVVALPLTAVLVLHASAAELALIGAAQALPILFLSLPVGGWVDRRTGRWPILLAGDLVRAALLVAVPVAAATGVLSLPVLAAIAFLISVAETFFDLAFAGWLPRLLQGDDLHRVNARVELARSTAVVLGRSRSGARRRARARALRPARARRGRDLLRRVGGADRLRPAFGGLRRSTCRRGAGPREIGARGRPSVRPRDAIPPRRARDG